jgi:hypothetical protein
LTPIELTTGFRIKPYPCTVELNLKFQQKIKRWAAPFSRLFVAKRSCQMREVVIRFNITKTCSKCSESKLIFEFSYKWIEERYESECRRCVAERKKKLYRQRMMANKEISGLRGLDENKAIHLSYQFDSSIAGKPSKSAIDDFSKILSTGIRDLIEDGSI